MKLLLKMLTLLAITILSFLAGHTAQQKTAEVMLLKQHYKFVDDSTDRTALSWAATFIPGGATAAIAYNVQQGCKELSETNTKLVALGQPSQEQPGYCFGKYKK